MKYCPVGSYIFLKNNPIVTGDRTPMSIGYRYNSSKFLGYIATEGSGSNEPVDTYLSHFPEIFCDVSNRSIVRPRFLGSYFNACCSIDNQNNMSKYDIVLENYWVTQSGYFILATKVAFGMGITDGKLLLYHGISEGSVDNKIEMID